jgi:hypothetical protein
MFEKLLIGIVLAVVLTAFYLLYRARRPGQQRCPACQRLGRGAHYGRYRCSACGAHFVLDATGRTARTAWGVSHVPLLFLSVAVASVVFDLIVGPADMRVPPLMIALTLAFGGWELYQTLREKLFTQDGTSPEPTE